MKKNKNNGFKVLFLFVFVFFGGLLIKQQSMINRLNSDYESSVEQKEKLKAQNEQLKEEQRKSKNENYNENLARENLGMIGEGEIFLRDKNKSK